MSHESRPDLLMFGHSKLINHPLSHSEFPYNSDDEGCLTKKLIPQVRKVIGPFAAPKKIIIIPNLSKTQSGKIMPHIMCKISTGEGDQLNNLSTLADPSVVNAIKAKVSTSS
ncbi:hypothetical protein BJ322DRAFT_1113055 [Thelephora terrestris]|uniref:AMP-binding enzyme C-terminal domain-containing protein n=1 Tax=Thelephora terrestris TaxID=56493 RepID=A0A9P6H7F9_9AGAM|nr:hypothetical protein BJ322DRAFT_1113055 [Thelephora terrestris]